MFPARNHSIQRKYCYDEKIDLELFTNLNVFSIPPLEYEESEFWNAVYVCFPSLAHFIHI
jgi:hypothetical protein